MTSGVRGQKGAACLGTNGNWCQPGSAEWDFSRQPGAGKDAPNKVAGEIVKFAFFDPSSSGLEC